MYFAEKFEKFLESVNLNAYREKYRPIKIVEMDLSKEIQAIEMLYEVYWNQKQFIGFDDFYQKYWDFYKTKIKNFQRKTGMCLKCFKKGLPARIYRTWASIITQIHAGYVAESVFGKNTVEMSAELDRRGADFQVKYRGKILNYQVKKESFSREVRQDSPQPRNPLLGEFIDIKYEVPSQDYFKNPKKRNGEYKLPYLRFTKNEELKRLPNGFVVFTRHAFEDKKKEIDERLK